MTHWKQKVAMATSYYNGYKMSVKGVKLKSECFFNISWRFGVTEENLRGGGADSTQVVQTGLISSFLLKHIFS